MCHYIDQDNRKRSCFLCIQCGHRDHADVNAAKNISDLSVGGSFRAGGSQPADDAPSEQSEVEASPSVSLVSS